MSRMRIIAVLLLACAVVVAVLQRAAVSKVRQENSSLLQAREEEAWLKQENENLARLRQENQEAQDLRMGNRDLLKLRNEVRQLRDQTSEVEKLRQQNESLVSQIKSMTDGTPPRLSQMEGYAAKETWSNAGFATPEAALQTFLAAARDGRVQSIFESMSPEMRSGFEKQLGSKSEEERQKALQEDLGPLTRMGGYRIAGKEQIAEDKVLLGIQAAKGGMVVKMVLRKFGAEWKFHDVETIK